MRLLPLVILLFFAFHSKAQNNAINVVHNEIVIGTNPVTHQDIKAIEHIFPERIHDFYLDTLSGYLTLQLRGLTRNERYLKNGGNLVQYNLDSRRVQWTKRFAYQASQLQQFDNIIIESSANKSFCLDIHTGRNRWEVKNNIYFFDPFENIGVGYKHSMLEVYINTLEGINLENGSVLWKRELSREYGWNSIRSLNDSTVLIVAGGLHTINIHTGKGWDYTLLTGEKDYTATALANTAGIAVGLLTGTFVMSTGHNLVRDVVSNVMIDSAYVYMAAREKISKVGKSDGEIVWATNLPKEMTSNSSIFMNDSLIFMVNYAHAFMGARQIDYGKPFIAAFNKISGEQKYFSAILTEKESVISYLIKQDTLYLLFEKKLSGYSLKDGSQLVEKIFNTGETGNLKGFIGAHVFTCNHDSIFSSLPLIDTTQCYIYSDTDKVYGLDHHFNITQTLPLEDMYVNYMDYNDLKFLSKKNKTYLINSSHQLVVELPITRNAFILGNKLYDIREKSFLEINLEEIKGLE